jgi:hypothetical protein
MAVFWVVVPCSPVEVYQRALMMEAARTSETLVNFYQTVNCSSLIIIGYTIVITLTYSNPNDSVSIKI